MEPISTAVMIGGNLLSGYFGSKAAKKAARARVQGFENAVDANRVAYDDAIGFIDPRLDQEQMAMGRVNSLLGLSGDAPDYDVFRDTPGYQFQLDQGTQAIERSAAARGGVASGNTLAELTKYSQGLADTTFNNYLAQVMGLQNQGTDRLAAGLATDRGVREADYRIGQGGARASGITGASNAWQNAIGGIAGAAGDYFGGGGFGGNSLSKISPPPDYWSRQAEIYGG